MRWIFAVTTPQLTETGRMTYEFMLAPGVPDEILRCNVWGLLSLHGEDLDRWNLHLFNSGGFVSTGGVDADPPHETQGLQRLLTCDKQEVYGVALLMDRDIFDRFEAVCRALGIEVKVHHHAGPLSTS